MTAQTLSQHDRAVLAAITNPEYATGQLNPADLAPFLARPEIQQALDSHLALRELRLKLKLAAATERAIDTLDHLSSTATDPTESRRASIALLALAARLNGPPRSPSRTAAAMSPTPRPSRDSSDPPGPRIPASTIDHFAPLSPVGGPFPPFSPVATGMRPPFSALDSRIRTAPSCVGPLQPAALINAAGRVPTTGEQRPAARRGPQNDGGSREPP